MSVSLQPPPSTRPRARWRNHYASRDTRHAIDCRRPYVRPAIDSAKKVCGVAPRSITPAPPAHHSQPETQPFASPQTNNPDPILALLNYSLFCADAEPTVCWWRRPRRCRWVCCWCHSLDRASLSANDTPPPRVKKPKHLIENYSTTSFRYHRNTS